MPRQKKITPLSNSPRITSTLAEWTARHANQDLLRFIVCGGAADGKSTLIDRLLWESEQVLDGELSAQAADSIHRGSISNDINFALLEDSLIKERKQLITTGVTYRFFSSPRRKFIAADMPTQAQYASNLVSAASTADVALLLIDAHQGVVMQTHSLAYLISLAGIRHIILVLNKMDLVGYDGQVFDAIVVQFRALAQTLGLASITAVPVSALKGGNITTHSAHMPWYQGPTLMSGLDSIDVNPQLMYKAAFPVQWINRPNASFKGFGGTLASGELAVGDEVRVTASGQVAKVKRIVTADADLQKARAGDAITLVLDRDVDAGRGDVLAKADQPLEITDQFEATLVWMQDEPGLMGRAYEIKLANQWASASITALKYRVDVNTLGHESCRQLELNDIAVANLALSKPLVFDAYADCRTLGGFILVDKFSHATVAAGMVRHNLRRAQNVHRQALSITRQDRERLNGHHSKVIWFTGLSGSGKSTIANMLEMELHTLGKRTYILDGDNIRQGLNKDLGFTDADRVENIRRVAEVAKKMMDAGLIVMTAFISPFRAERQMARELIGEDNFIEVFVDTPLAICEQRDPKGLYKKARSGQLPNMTGINSPYEAPTNPELTINTHQRKIEEELTSILVYLEREK